MSTTDEIRTTAKEAYLYAFAMMESYGTWYPQAAVPSSPTYVGGFNVFRHYAQAFTPDNKDIVTPNNDTPYSWAWLDLRAEPVVVSVPQVPADRYYVLQCIDLFTYNMAYIGSRATGNGAGDYLFIGPQWKGSVPTGFAKVFHSETQIVGILGRTQLKNSGDVDNVKKVQAGYRIAPLSAFAKTAKPSPAPKLAFPPYDKAKASTHDFIGYLSFLLSLAEPPHPKEVALRQRFETIGAVPGQAWDASKVDATTLAAIDDGIEDAKRELESKEKVVLGSNGLFGSRDALGENYLMRDVAAAKGLFGNSLEEAWYGGWVGDGTKLQRMHFPKGQLPPAKFFWSATLYTLPDRFLHANPLKRYSIGDRTEGLRPDADGGLTIYIGHASPGSERESNWLPAPPARYSLVVRVYGPSEEAMTGAWKLPALEEAN